MKDKLKPIPLNCAREIRDITSAKRVLIIAVDDSENYQMATWAHTEDDGKDAAAFIGSDEAIMAARALASAKRQRRER